MKKIFAILGLLIVVLIMTNHKQKFYNLEDELAKLCPYFIEPN